MSERDSPGGRYKDQSHGEEETEGLRLSPVGLDDEGSEGVE